MVRAPRFDEPLRFVEASTKTVRITGSRLPAFNGARMRTEGILNFHLSVIDQLLRLDRARVAGEISLRGAQVGDGTGEAIAGSVGGRALPRSALSSVT